MENEVGKYLSRFYGGSISVQQMADMMHNLGSNPLDSQSFKLFDGIIKVLLSECKFYSKYPAEELRLTAQLFGTLLNRKLFHHNIEQLSLALDFILEGLRQNVVTKLYQFGYIAVMNFQETVTQYPSFSHSLSKIPTNDLALEKLQRSCIDFNRHLSESELNLICLDQISMHSGYDENDIHSPFQLINQIIKWEGNKDDRASIELIGSSKIKRGGESFGAGEMERLMDKIAEHPLITPPPPQVAERVFGAFNNICATNVSTKASEISPLIESQHLNWLSLYIVKCRASKEPNLHDVYVSFIELLNIPKMFDLVLTLTYACIKVCLQYVDELKLLASYRTLLKNLGLWLGKITLSRNVPIMSRHVDLKALTIDSYERGCLSSVLPFTIKTLEGIKDSKIFKPPNPWTMALISLLIEIHDLPNLKTNIVFEIALLLNSIGVDIESERGKLKRNTLSSRTRPVDSADFNSIDIQNNGNTPLNVASPTGITPQNMTPMVPHPTIPIPHNIPPPTNITPIMDGVFTPPQDMGQNNLLVNMIAHVMNRGLFTAHGLAVGEVKPPIDRPILEYGQYADKLLKQIPKLVVISPTIALFEIQPHLKSIIPLALDRAVRKVLPDLERHCISIAKVTSLRLVSKDFSSHDTELARRAACMSITSLAGSLALVTCKEPLRLACHESLRLALQQHRTKDSNDQILIEQIVQVLTNDNLITMSGLVVKAITERVSKLFDELFISDSQLLDKLQENPIRLPLYLQLSSPPSQTQLNVYRRLSNNESENGILEQQQQQQQQQQEPSKTSDSIQVNCKPKDGDLVQIALVCGSLSELSYDNELLAHLLLLYYTTEDEIFSRHESTPKVNDIIKLMIERLPQGFLPSILDDTKPDLNTDSMDSPLDLSRKLTILFCNSVWGFQPRALMPQQTEFIEPQHNTSSSTLDMNQIATGQQLFQRMIRRWTALCRDPMINTQGTRLGYVWIKFDEKMRLSAAIERMGRSDFYRSLLPCVPESDFDCLIKLVQGIDLVEKLKIPANLKSLVDATCYDAVNGDLESGWQRTCKLFLQLIDGYLATPTSLGLTAASLIAQALLRLFPLPYMNWHSNPLCGWCNVASHAHLMTKLLSTPTHWPLLFQLLKRIIIYDSKFKDLSTEDSGSQVAMILCDISIGCPEFIVKYHLPLLSHLPRSRRDLWNLVTSAAPRNSVIPDPRACDEVELLPGSSVDVDRPIFSTLLLQGPLMLSIEEFLSKVSKIDDIQEFDLLMTIRTCLYSQLHHLHLRHRPDLLKNSEFGEDSLDYTLTMKLLFSLLSFQYEKSADESLRTQLNSLVLFLLMSTEGNVRRWLIKALTAFLRYPNRQTLHFSKLYQWLVLEGKDGDLGYDLVHEVYTALSCSKPQPWGVTLVLLEVLKMDIKSMGAFTNRVEFLEQLFALVTQMFGGNSLPNGHGGNTLSNSQDHAWTTWK